MSVSAMTRKTTLTALAAAGALALVASAAAAQPFYKAPPAQDWDGMWMIQNAPEALKTTDGKTPPMTAEASKLYKAHLAARKAGKPTGLPATEPVATFPVELRGTEVYVDVTTTLNGVTPQ